ncbi:hypothetical protein BVG16_26550 [Paenibacillus selenitireducens]|uniref:DUF6933 domain-containing protein n=1 Tax=Paenibacillus selenitireducens TaxID=1324314 RepID=A0A1T2X1B6_9BACL|nr:hypothetical protein [Paenibacillus selenitireducens]OPA73664.1 hypothetical protein BVG16_26550 [Paenibacillus selenitireducens]
MFVLRFTQSLIKDMKVTPVECNDISPLFNWHVNIYKLNNRKHIVFVNDLSRLCVIIDGIRTGQITALKEKFLLTLRIYLSSEGIDENLINSYIQDGLEYMISKTNNRSVLGTMKEITWFTADDFDDNIQRLKWHNKIIHKPIEYNKPIKVFKEALKRHY